MTLFDILDTHGWPGALAPVPANAWDGCPDAAHDESSQPADFRPDALLFTPAGVKFFHREDLTVAGLETRRAPRAADAYVFALKAGRVLTTLSSAGRMKPERADTILSCRAMAPDAESGAVLYQKLFAAVVAAFPGFNGLADLVFATLPAPFDWLQPTGPGRAQFPTACVLRCHAPFEGLSAHATAGLMKQGWRLSRALRASSRTI